MSPKRMRPLAMRGQGLSLAADAYGEGSRPPVLLLHGGGQTRHAWGSAGEALAAAERRAITLDLRGHGNSDWAPDGDYSLLAFAADVRSVAASLGQLPALVGASLGGLGSLVAIGESADAIATALVLVDVTPTLEERGTGRIVDFMRSGIDGFASLDDAAKAVATFLPDRSRPTDTSGLRKNLRCRDGRWFWHWDPAFLWGERGLAGQPANTNRDRLVAAARRVEVPTLLVRGRMSDVVSEAGIDELRELIPHAEFVDVAGAGHMIAGDRNDAFNDVVIDFLTGL